ncbi:MAG TPA: 50S ribosomal protein L18 [Candidatus Saccharimonadales bacterium]|nr:50S ribosomal protein L18 [Candidatus Saccharimonadales bacterium]
MNTNAHKLFNRFLRKRRIRSRVMGTPERPRLTVTISNRQISAQVIDDTKHKTLASSTTNKSAAKGTMTERATWVGTDIGKKAKKAGVNNVTFDRNGKQYHGRVAALADAARKEGLEF